MPLISEWKLVSALWTSWNFFDNNQINVIAWVCLMPITWQYIIVLVCLVCNIQAPSKQAINQLKLARNSRLRNFQWKWQAACLFIEPGCLIYHEEELCRLFKMSEPAQWKRIPSLRMNNNNVLLYSSLKRKYGDQSPISCTTTLPKRKGKGFTCLLWSTQALQISDLNLDHVDERQCLDYPGSSKSHWEAFDKTASQLPQCETAGAYHF